MASSPAGGAESTTVTRPDPSIAPITCIRHRSRAQIAASRALSLGLIRMQSFSWYSAPQISSTDIDASPRATLRMSIVAPSG